MKKFTTLLFTLAIAFSLAVPVSAKWPHLRKKHTATTSEQSKSHEKHAKKKGATKGKKEGQQATAPSGN
jgi:hypothetical protein